MKSSYKVRAMRFIEKYFDRYLDMPEEATIWDWAEMVTYLNKFEHRHVEFRHGACRFALLTSDYVIKFDYDEHNVKTFGGCARELACYQYARRRGMSGVLAEITLMEYKGKKFYIMPRATAVGHTHLDWDDMCDVEELGIWDVHEGNIGRVNGWPVVIDYAAWDGE